MKSTNEFARFLTNSSGGLLDFFNIGGLASERTKNTLWGLWHHYSWRELFIRSSIVATTVTLGLMAANYGEEEERLSLSRGVMGASIGFFVSHAIAVVPTIRQRNKIKTDTQSLIQAIENKLQLLEQSHNRDSVDFSTLQQLITDIRTTVKQASNLILPVTKKGDAVRNLATIRTLVRNIHGAVEEMTVLLNDRRDTQQSALLLKTADFWKQDFNTIREQLTSSLQENNPVISPAI